jgi:hypothetical protein
LRVNVWAMSAVSSSIMPVRSTPGADARIPKKACRPEH